MLRTTPHRRRRRATFALCLLCGLGAAAPPLAAEEPAIFDELFEPWRWRVFGLEDGLPHPRVRHLVEARDGTVWVGTDAGVAWYDGYEFQPAPDVPQAPTVALCEDGSGRIALLLLTTGTAAWIGDRGGFRPIVEPGAGTPGARQWHGLAVTREGTLVGHARASGEHYGEFVLLDGRGRTAYALADGPRVDARSFEDAITGRGAWIATWGGCVELTDAGFGATLALPQGSRATRVLVEPERGRALVAVTSPLGMRGGWQLDPGGAGRVPGTEGDLVLAFDAAPTGEAIVLLRSGRAAWRDRAGVWSLLRRVPEPLQDATLVRFRADGDLWVGGMEGLRLLGRRGLGWESWRHGGEGELNSVLAIAPDGAGGHWLGLSDGLEHRLADGTTERHTRALGHALQTVTALATDGSGRLWVGSGAGAFPGVLIRQDDGWVHVGAAAGLSARAVHKLRPAPDGRMVILTLPDLGAPPGVWIGDGASFEHMDPCAGSDGATRYYDAAWTPDGALWIASDGGLARIRGADVRVLQPEDGLRQRRVWAVEPAPDGGVWFGHESTSSGLGRVSPAGAIEYLEPSDRSSSPYVTALAADPSGRLWIGAEDGLLLLEDDLLQRVDRRNGLAQARVNCIAPAPDLLVVGTDRPGALALGLSPSGSAPPRVRVDTISVDGTNVDLRWSVASHFGEDPYGTLHSRHRVDGGPWSRWSVAREARLQDLSHGRHEVELEVANALRRARATAAFDVVDPTRQTTRIAVPLALLALLASGVGAWSISRRLREARAHRETSERFAQLAASVRDVFWLVDWKARRALYVSPAFERVFGLRRDELDAFGANWRQRVHDDDQAEVARSYREGIEEQGEWDCQFRVVHADGRLGWVHARAVAIRDEAGAVARVAGVAEEVTERREAEAQQALLSLELDHRVKNSLAQVLALADQTLRAADDLAQFRESFFGRLRSLARTHEALASTRWRGLRVRELVRRSVESLVGASRLTVAGPDVQLVARASTPLGLSLHELATNALKHGSLTRPEGRVEVGWTAGEGDSLTLVWQEHGAPGAATAREPEDEGGLGTRLVRGMIEHELGGTVEMEFGPRGLRCTLHLPGAVRSSGEGTARPAGMPDGGDRQPSRSLR